MAVNPDTIATKAWELILTYGPKVVLAILTLIIGFWIIGWAGKAIGRLMKKRKVDPTLQPFLRRIATVSLKVMLLISVAGMVGIEVTSFIAVLGAAGLAIGLALQGSLANFAGGVLILLFKPYTIGDYITAQGEGGTVNKIDIFHTTLKTPDNRTVIIPNGPLANGNITNYSTEPTRKLEWEFGISYDDDLKKAKKAIEGLLKKEKRILHDQGLQIVISGLGDNSVNITARAWVKKEDYWDVNFDIREKAKLTFDKQGISFPFPQMDVHLQK